MIENAISLKSHTYDLRSKQLTFHLSFTSTHSKTSIQLRIQI